MFSLENLARYGLTWDPIVITGLRTSRAASQTAVSRCMAAGVTCGNIPSVKPTLTVESRGSMLDQMKLWRNSSLAASCLDKLNIPKKSAMILYRMNWTSPKVNELVQDELNISKGQWTCPGWTEHLQRSMNLSRMNWTSPKVNELVQDELNISKGQWTCPGWTEHLQRSMNLSRMNWTSPKVNELAQDELNISKVNELNISKFQRTCTGLTEHPDNLMDDLNGISWTSSKNNEFVQNTLNIPQMTMRLCRINWKFLNKLVQVN